MSQPNEPVEVVYDDGSKAYLTVPTAEEIAAQHEWVSTQLDKLTDAFGSLTIEEG